MQEVRVAPGRTGTLPSAALQQWTTVRAAALDEIANAHRVVGGSGPGRRTLTQQINQAYAVLLSSQFQAFCRDLHTECAKRLAVAVHPVGLQQPLFLNAVYGRKLDAGNPNPGNIGADFNRLGLAFWPAVDASPPPRPQRKVLLEEVNVWRNAIAHQDFAPAMLRGGHAALQLSQVQAWRKACDGLARSFDGVMDGHLLAVTGVAPW
jgi:hypothetical protein